MDLLSVFVAYQRCQRTVCSLFVRFRSRSNEHRTNVPTLWTSSKEREHEIVHTINAERKWTKYRVNERTEPREWEAYVDTFRGVQWFCLYFLIWQIMCGSAAFAFSFSFGFFIFALSFVCIIECHTHWSHYYLFKNVFGLSAFFLSFFLNET